MKQLDRHLLMEFAPSFFAAVVLFAVLVLVASGPLFSAIASLTKGASPWLILEIMGLYMPQMFKYAFPMAMLIAVILGYTRLSSDSEAVAMFSAGISFYRMLWTTACFALGIMIVGLWINNVLMPIAQKRIESLKKGIAKAIAPTTQPFQLPPIIVNGKPQAIVFAGGGYDDTKKALINVTIIEFDPATGKPSQTIFAKSAKYGGAFSWVADEVQEYGSSGLVVTHAGHIVLTDIHGTPEEIEPLETNLDDYSFTELSRQIEARQAAGASSKDIRLAEVDLWQKIALPCATLVFALVGAPIALRPQRASSRGVAVAMGIGIIVGYYALFKILETVATAGGIDPALAAFTPNVLGLVLAGVLIARSTT
jgi:lipopolysaccharide export system permease protein